MLAHTRAVSPLVLRSPHPREAEHARVSLQQPPPLLQQQQQQQHEVFFDPCAGSGAWDGPAVVREPAVDICIHRVDGSTCRFSFTVKPGTQQAVLTPPAPCLIPGQCGAPSPSSTAGGAAAPLPPALSAGASSCGPSPTAAAGQPPRELLTAGTAQGYVARRLGEIDRQLDALHGQWQSSRGRGGEAAVIRSLFIEREALTGESAGAPAGCAAPFAAVQPAADGGARDITVGAPMGSGALTGSGPSLIYRDGPRRTPHSTSVESIWVQRGSPHVHPDRGDWRRATGDPPWLSSTPSGVLHRPLPTRAPTPPEREHPPPPPLPPPQPPQEQPQPVLPSQQPPRQPPSPQPHQPPQAPPPPQAAHGPKGYEGGSAEASSLRFIPVHSEHGDMTVSLSSGEGSARQPPQRHASAEGGVRPLRSALRQPGSPKHAPGGGWEAPPPAPAPSPPPEMPPAPPPASPAAAVVEQRPAAPPPPPAAPPQPQPDPPLPPLVPVAAQTPAAVANPAGSPKGPPGSVRNPAGSPKGPAAASVRIPAAGGPQGPAGWPVAGGTPKGTPPAPQSLRIKQPDSAPVGPVGGSVKGSSPPRRSSSWNRTPSASVGAPAAPVGGTPKGSPPGGGAPGVRFMSQTQSIRPDSLPPAAPAGGSASARPPAAGSPKTRPGAGAVPASGLQGAAASVRPSTATVRPFQSARPGATPSVTPVKFPSVRPASRSGPGGGMVRTPAIGVSGR
eukprot:TRINITY_DN21233_c0_g1_i2.p1 TRINITY_DN21233_c0_g1~~TRINITY_DN21233_c0_g1_i2.p1  ORF type:complete len:753 (+),score=153.28 TRINITY_DN21233_c0_g1_i2:74-2260(+)